MDSIESAGGRLGAVLSAPRSGMVSLGPKGPWLAASPALARQVLTDPQTFDFPGDVSRSSDLSASRSDDTRSGHVGFPSLTSTQVAVGQAVFSAEWSHAVAISPHDSERIVDAMQVLRRPVARGTTAAVLPDTGKADRNDIADKALEWIDALGPVIAARRPPRRWSRARRAERDTRFALEDRIAAVHSSGQSPTHTATMLAAGIQVPIAAGAWMLAWLAQHPTPDVDPVHASWETLRLTPPTWITPRLTTQDVTLGGQKVPAGHVVFVSPLLLGRMSALVPGDPTSLREFDPDRWRDATRRPGSWLPFGAGPHACPGRTLGLAVLTHLAQWASLHEISLAKQVGVDQSRGIAPAPCHVIVAPRRMTPA